MPETAELIQVDAVPFKQNKQSDFKFGETVDFKKQAARDNRLWLLAFVIMLVVSSFMIWYLGLQDNAVEQQATIKVAARRADPFGGDRYRAVGSVITTKLYSLGITNTWVRFVDKDRVEVELPRTTDRGLIPAVVDIVRQSSEKQLKLRPKIALYFAKTPGTGSRSMAPMDEAPPAP